MKIMLGCAALSLFAAPTLAGPRPPVEHLGKAVEGRPLSTAVRAGDMLYLSGQLQLEFNPQGTLAERIRAGGAGIPAFFTKTGVGTLVAEGKEVRDFDGERYVMERGLKADLAIVKAWKGDAEGNLIYRKTARNFNPMMATAGRVTLAEVEEIVPVGALDKDSIHTPGIFVDALFKGAAFEKRIEQLTTRPKEAA